MADSRRPKVLVVTRNLPPLTGGMERLNLELIRSLGHWADVRVVGPTGSAAPLQAIPVSEVTLKPLPKFLVFSFIAAVRTTLRWRPDIILAGSGLMAPIVKIASLISGASSAVYVHGLDIVARHPAYRVLWRPALRGMKVIIANSSPTAALCTSIGIDRRKVRVVYPGTHLRASVASAEEVREVRARLDVGEGPVLLSVGRFTRRKGLLEFVENVLPRIVMARPGSVLLVAGSAPLDALNRNETSQAEIESAASASGLRAHIRFLGAVSDAQLADLYTAADVHVFPVRSLPGDPEGFGMVAIEAASHGVPTVAYAVGGVVDAVGPGKSGVLVFPDDAEGFCGAVLQVLTMREDLRRTSPEFARGFSWSVFGEGIRAAVEPVP